jgi:blue copper oxidase
MIGSMFRRLIGSTGGVMGINGKALLQLRIDAELKQGETLLGRVSAPMMIHPFHVHGCSFQVVSRAGQPVDPRTEGHKDVVVVDRRGVEILLRVDQKADKKTPFMLHCHILQHEDAGMMGQFTVT